jgi:translation initiation factor 4E
MAAVSETITAFDDPQAYNVKHPLANSWTLWFDSPSNKKTTQANWSANLKNLITIDTVEDFWGVYKHVSKVNELSLGSNYHFFKKDVRPEWEDPVNSKGGKWVFSASKTKNDELDSHWLNIVISVLLILVVGYYWRSL